MIQVFFMFELGNYQQALQCYKQIHKQFPENVDCLRFMVRLCNDLGLKEAQDYSLMLRKAEKSVEARRQRELSSGSGKSSGGSSGSRGHGSTISSTIRARIQQSTGGNYHNIIMLYTVKNVFQSDNFLIYM